jgi:hypothetical protein
METETLALPTPEFAPLIVIHGTLLVAVHAQLFPVVVNGILCVAGSEYGVRPDSANWNEQPAGS